MRPLQMRGVLRPAGRPIRDGDRRLRIGALQAACLYHLALTLAAGSPASMVCTLPGLRRSREPRHLAAARAWRLLCDSLALRTTNLRMNRPAEPRTKQQPSLAHGVAGTRSLPGRLSLRITGCRPPEVAADFERLGTCQRKGESAVGASTDSVRSTI